MLNLGQPCKQGGDASEGQLQMKLPEPNHSIQALVDRHHESQAEPPRPHMGASQIGHPCDRWLWLSFRWAVVPQFPGRILRVFRRGRNEEDTIVSDLRAIGLDVRGAQKRVDFGCHVSGSLDAIIESGVPGSAKRHIAEFKTHSRKSFEYLDKHGVEKSKPEHFVQMQAYMHGTGIERALYVASARTTTTSTPNASSTTSMPPRRPLPAPSASLCQTACPSRSVQTQAGINASSATPTSSATRPTPPSTSIAAPARTARPRTTALGDASGTMPMAFLLSSSAKGVKAMCCTRIWCPGR